MICFGVRGLYVRAAESRKPRTPNLAKPNIWEVVRTKEGTFDILHKGKLLRAKILDKWLEDELGKYGFCSEEYRDFRRQLEETDKAQIVL